MIRPSLPHGGVRSAAAAGKLQRADQLRHHGVVRRGDAVLLAECGDRAVEIRDLRRAARMDIGAHGRRALPRAVEDLPDKITDLLIGKALPGGVCHLDGLGDLLPAERPGLLTLLHHADRPVKECGQRVDRQIDERLFPDQTVNIRAGLGAEAAAGEKCCRLLGERRLAAETADRRDPHAAVLADRGVRKTLAVDGRGADQDLLRTEELLQRLPVADAVLQRQDDRLRPDAAADAFDGVARLERLDEHDQKVKDLRNLRRTDGAERPARDRPLVGLDGQAGLLDGLCLLLPVRQKRDVRPAGEIAAEQTAHRAGPNDPDFHRLTPFLLTRFRSPPGGPGES